MIVFVTHTCTQLSLHHEIGYRLKRHNAWVQQILECLNGAFDFSTTYILWPATPKQNKIMKLRQETNDIFQNPSRTLTSLFTHVQALLVVHCPAHYYANQYANPSNGGALETSNLGYISRLQISSRSNCMVEAKTLRYIDHVAVKENIGNKHLALTSHVLEHSYIAIKRYMQDKNVQNTPKKGLLSNRKWYE